MFCPSCGTQNLATSLRCIQCGTVLVRGIENQSVAYRQGAHLIDTRIYGGVGALLACALAAVLLNSVLEDLYLNQKAVYFWSAIAGAALGRLAAWLKWKR
jgi:hypothetical protein